MCSNWVFKFALVIAILALQSKVRQYTENSGIYIDQLSLI